MRLNDSQIAAIRRVVAEQAGEEAQVRLFGSRLNDQAKGGDVDLLVQVQTHVAEPALLIAAIGGRVSRAMHGRKVDVLLTAPNLIRQPIHNEAEREGVLL